jgi:hypothetical protein
MKLLGLKMVRALLGVITIIWFIGLAREFVVVLSDPDPTPSEWPRFLLALLIALLPAWGYFKLSKALETGNDKR